MKKFRDYSEEIYKCTKCGLCQAVCPIFRETGLETSVSRGKFTLLNGIINGQVEFNKNVAKSLQLCLGCRACFEFCPAGINAEEIITAARAEYAEQHGVNPNKKLVIKGLNLFRKLRNIGSSGKTAKIIYFPGCFDTSQKAVKTVLEMNGFDVYIPKGFSCCGMAARTSGDLATFKRFAENNIRQIPDDTDFILTDCASCGSAWEFYPKEIAQKAVNIYKFLDSINLHIPENANFHKTVTWHDPCHLGRFQHVTEEPRNILKKIPGLKFIEMKEADSCCGAAGTFCLAKPGISLAISKRKAGNIINTGAEIVSTGCSGCKIGILQGLAAHQTLRPIISPIEILAGLYS